MAIEYKRGDAVEVCGTQEGFLGSYFGATIISSIGAGEFIVEYRTLVGDDKLAPLREIVGAGDVRPKPPEANVKEFMPREEVDAWDNDGWWSGRVVKRWFKSKRYQVYFHLTRDQKNYNLSELRVHCDWEDGRWACSRRGFQFY